MAAYSGYLCPPYARLPTRDAPFPHRLDKGCPPFSSDTMSAPSLSVDAASDIAAQPSLGEELLFISGHFITVHVLWAVFTSLPNPRCQHNQGLHCCTIQDKTRSSRQTTCLKISSLIKLNSSPQLHSHPPPTRSPSTITNRASTTLYENARNIIGAFVQCKGRKLGHLPPSVPRDFFLSF